MALVCPSGRMYDGYRGKNSLRILHTEIILHSIDDKFFKVGLVLSVTNKQTNKIIFILNISIVIVHAKFLILKNDIVYIKKSLKRRIISLLISVLITESSVRINE